MGEAQRKYYAPLSDEEIEKKVKDLAPNQTKRFEFALVQEDDRRRALFIASSYSRE